MAYHDRATSSRVTEVLEQAKVVLPITHDLDDIAMRKENAKRAPPRQAYKTMNVETIPAETQFTLRDGAIAFRYADTNAGLGMQRPRPHASGAAGWKSAQTYNVPVSATLNDTRFATAAEANNEIVPMGIVKQGTRHNGSNFALLQIGGSTSFYHSGLKYIPPLGYVQGSAPDETKLEEGAYHGDVPDTNHQRRGRVELVTEEYDPRTIDIGSVARVKAILDNAKRTTAEEDLLAALGVAMDSFYGMTKIAAMRPFLDDLSDAVGDYAGKLNDAGAKRNVVTKLKDVVDQLGPNGLVAWNNAIRALALFKQFATRRVIGRTMTGAEPGDDGVIVLGQAYCL
jgi:hypothetical protein